MFFCFCFKFRLIPHEVEQPLQDKDLTEKRQETERKNRIGKLIGKIIKIKIAF